MADIFSAGSTLTTRTPSSSKNSASNAPSLPQFQYDDITDDPEEIIEEFRDRYYDSKLFFDPFAGGKFAQYLFAAHKNPGTQFTSDSAHHLIEETQLFIEAVHSCYNRMRMEAAESA